MSKKDNSNKTKIFSFDIGTASIGWSVVNHPKEEINFDENTGEVFDNIEIEASGVRMFNEPLTPKDRKLLNLSRRTNRLSRRRTRRVALRKVAIKKLLLTLGYYKSEDFDHYLENGEINYNSVFQRVILDNKKEPSHHNIFYLRVKALDHQLTKDELAVVLFNLAKTRGFKSSKKLRPNEDELAQIEKEDKESGAVLKAIQELTQKQKDIKEQYGKDTRTFSELIYFLNSKGELNSYRNKDSDYSNSILRKEIENEVKLIFAKQREFYKELTEEFEEKFLDAMLHQRHIKFNLESVGKCTYLKQEYRASKSCFSSEYYTSLGRLINVRIKLFQGKERELNKQEIHEILNKTQENFGNLTYKQLRKYLGLSEKDSFKGLSYDDETQKSGIYAGDKIEEDKKKYIISFEETKEVDKYLKELLGKGDLSEDNYKTIVNNPKILDQLVQLNALYNENDIKEEIKNDEDLKVLSQEIKDAIIYCNLSFTKYLALSLKAIYLMLPYMEEVYPKVEVAGIKTDAEDTTTRWESKKVIDKLIEDKVFVKDEPIKYQKLPSIFEIEKKGDFYIPNHAVIKRALSQIIKTFNAMVSKYGKPNLVNIELLRELKNPSAKKEHISKREDNTIERESAREDLKQSGLEDSEANILKIRLWKEQSHSCPYCQTNISKSDLENENFIQIDHIIPESKSFDNSYNNKVLVCTKCNQDKLQRTPYLWLGDGQEWEKLKNWVYSSSLSQYKKDKLLNRQNLDEITQGFVNRQLNDSAYITILIKDFIDGYFKFPEDGKKRHVYATKGGLTSILRDIFSFKKYRDYKALEQDKGRFLYREVVWKNPEIAEKLNSIQDKIKLAKKEINEAKKKGEKEPEQVLTTLTNLNKEFEGIKKGFIEYLPAYFSSTSNSEEDEIDNYLESSNEKSSKKNKKLKIPDSIKDYVNNPSFSAYLTELKFSNDFAEKFKEMEKNFIGDKHHAMDAILIGLITPSIIQGIGTLANQADSIIKKLANNTQDKEKNKLLKLLYNGRINQKIIFLLNNSNKIEELQKKGILKIDKLVDKILLLESIKDEIWKSLDKIFISRQPNRKVSGRIHEDTIYSAKETKKVEDKGKLKLTKRKNVSALSIEDILNNKVVATPTLKQALIDWINNKDENKPKFPTMPTNSGQQGHIIRKVTVITGDTGEEFYKVRGGLVNNDKKIRADVFKIKEVNKKGIIIYKYALRPISLADIILKKEVPLKLTGKNNGYLESEQGGENQEFMFSLYPNDLFYFKKDEKSESEYAYYLSYKMGNNQIEYTDHNKLKKSQAPDERLFVSIASLYELKKAQVDLLGNKSIVKNNNYENFSSLINKINNKKK